jgi:hypothetical protein
MRENKFQAGLIDRIKEMFPGCIVLKNDSGYLQGFPDLTVLYQDHWAVLECKRSSEESHQPNQDYYVSKTDTMSFGRFIFPENEEEVLRDLQQAFQSRGKTRVSKRK